MSFRRLHIQLYTSIVLHYVSDLSNFLFWMEERLCGCGETVHSHVQGSCDCQHLSILCCTMFCSYLVALFHLQTHIVWSGRKSYVPNAAPSYFLHTIEHFQSIVFSFSQSHDRKLILRLRMSTSLGSLDATTSMRELYT